MKEFKTKENLINFLYIFGPIVPLSYYLSYRYFKKDVPIKYLWGNIDKGLQKFYTFSMIMTTVSFLAIIVFIQNVLNDDTEIFGKKFKNGGFDYYFQPLALIILPSIIWMPITYLYLKKPNILWRYAIVAILATVALGGCLLMYALQNTNYKTLINNNLHSYNAALIGSKYLAFHLTVLDAIYWTYSFF